MIQKLLYWARLTYQDILYSGLEGKCLKSRERRYYALTSSLFLPF